MKKRFCTRQLLNVDDRKSLYEMIVSPNSEIFGKISGDKGYLSYGFRMNSDILSIPINGERREIRASKRVIFSVQFQKYN